MTPGGADAAGYRACWMTAQDGLKLFYRDYGDPLAETVPVICLGGLTRNSKDYHEIALRLSARRRVLCPDYRGRGRSSYDPDWRNYQPRVYLRDVIHLLAAANLEKVVICGTSLGGFLAMGMAVLSPTALAGVIMNDVGPVVETSGLEHIAAYIAEEHRFTDWDGAVAHVRKNYTELAYTTDAEWRHLAECTFREAEGGGVVIDWDVNIAKTFGTEVPDLWPLFGALRHIPALAFRGERSTVLAASTFERMGAANSELIRVTVPGVGHAPSLEEPESTEAIDDFLARIDRTRGHA